MPQTLFPVLRYRDPRAAIRFLEDAFGFAIASLHETDDGGVGHAELRHGASLVMLGPAGGEGTGQPPGTGSVYVVVGDADAVHARALSVHAEIVDAPRDLDYGSRDFSARDPEGNLWFFGTYAPE